MRNLGLLPKAKATNDLHGFSVDERNNHLAEELPSPSNNTNDVPQLRGCVDKRYNSYGIPLELYRLSTQPLNY